MAPHSTPMCKLFEVPTGGAAHECKNILGNWIPTHEFGKHIYLAKPIEYFSQISWPESCACLVCVCVCVCGRGVGGVVFLPRVFLLTHDNLFPENFLMCFQVHFNIFE